MTTVALYLKWTIQILNEIFLLKGFYLPSLILCKQVYCKSYDRHFTHVQVIIKQKLYVSKGLVSDSSSHRMISPAMSTDIFLLGLDGK